MSSSTRGANQHLLIKSLLPLTGEPVDVGTVTALVGPNNSGKTEVLRDILRLLIRHDVSQTGQPAQDVPPATVLRDLALVGQLGVERFVLGLKQLEASETGESVLLGIGPDLKTPLRRGLSSEVKNTLHRPLMTATAIATTPLGELLPLRVAYLDSEQRNHALAGTQAGSPGEAAASLLQLLQDAAAETHEQFDKIFATAFNGLHIRLDDTQRIRLALRVAEQFPASAADPLVALKQFQALPLLEEQGEGAMSFAAVVLSLLLLPGRIVLLDQPAGPLDEDRAHLLGAWISDHAARLGCQVFLTSRSQALLRGLHQGAADVGVVRMERQQGVTRLTSISKDVSTALACHPLLTSQAGLECLTAAGVVLTPDETDRVLYQSVAEFIHSASDLRFLHSYGLANLRVVAQALRRTGLPFGVIAELNVLSDERAFVGLIKALTGKDPPQPWLATRERLAGHVEGWFDERSLSSSSHEVENLLDQLKQGTAAEQASRKAATAGERRRWKWERLKQERLDVLPPELRSWVDDLLQDLQQIGLFISPRGNARAWMSDLLSFDRKQPWLLQSLEALRGQRCPNELQAFVATIIGHLRAQRLPARAARTGQGT